MATGGRVLHHLKAFAPDRKNTIVFSGFQAAGTRGRAMLEGAREIKIHGQWISVAAEVTDLPMLSAHADANELMRRSEEHTSELQSLMRISYAVFCLKKKKQK